MAQLFFVAKIARSLPSLRARTDSSRKLMPVRVRVDRRRLLLVHLLDGGGGRVDKLIWIG